MKRLVIVVIAALAGLAAFNYATTGELSLSLSVSRSDEERAVRDLQREFAAAQKVYAQAHRSAAVGGIDTTSDADAAVGSVKRIKRDLEALRKKLSEDKAKRGADDLMAAVQAFEKNL